MVNSTLNIIERRCYNLVGGVAPITGTPVNYDLALASSNYLKTLKILRRANGYGLNCSYPFQTLFFFA